jgi:hypothetical protein
MEIKQRLQFGAAVVAANGLLALLGGMSSGPALASSCAPITGCVVPNIGCAAWCQNQTPAGCTYTGYSMCAESSSCPYDPPIYWGVEATCDYD